MIKTPDDAAGATGPWYCKRRQLLRELPPRSRRRLEGVAAGRLFQTSDLLFDTGETRGVVHVVMEGRVRLVHFGADGEEVQLAVLEPGEAFHEPAHGEVEPVDVYAEAIESGRLLSVGLGPMLELVAHDPEAFELLATPFR